MKKNIIITLLALTIFINLKVCAATKHPVPRFVSLKSNEIKMRVGPGKEYPVKWILKMKGLPVKIIAEYDTWRQVQCHDGTTGWIHQSLLSGKRILITLETSFLLSSQDRDAIKIAKISPKTSIPFKLKNCKSRLCRIATDTQKGWIEKSQVWGLLETE